MKLSLGNQIRSNRLRLDMTQEQLAEKFGTSPQAISRWENGTTYPDIEMLPMIASFFGTTTDTLLGRTDEEKEKFCTDLQNSLTIATKEKDIEKTIEILKKIRCSLREYQNWYYWFWGIYRDLWNSRLFKNEQVLDEIRLLAEEIFAVCPRDKHFAVIEYMAYMENDENIDSFLNTYASREDQSRSRLLFNRYKERGESEKIEPVRHFLLWYELDHILTDAAEWQEYRSKDAAHFKWFSETQLNYLNAVNCLTPDKKHIVSGGGELDLWCEPRVILGLKYAWALAQLGEINAALDAFEDMVSVVEKVMSIQDDEFKLGCNSPALKGFALNCNFYWLDKNGKEYRELCLESNGWNDWIVPVDLLHDITSDCWFGSSGIDDARWDTLLERLRKCIIVKERDK